MTLLKRRVLIVSAVCSATYCYYHQKPAPPIPYVPPPFYWHTIPLSVQARLTVPPKENGVLWNTMTTLVIGTTGTLSKLFLKVNETKVYGLGKFLNILHDPTRKQGIITVSNHESVLDDPVLWGTLPMSTLWNKDRMRWVLGAADICYTSLLKSYFFMFGQTIPTIRGGGIYQPGMDFATHILQKGGWVHIYPESKVVQETTMIRFKWGIGRLLMASPETIVIPVWHQGMHRVKPLYEKGIHAGQKIVLVFGDPVSYQDLIEAWKQGQVSTEETRIRITQRMYDAVDKLRINNIY